jgi:hypothetical protein
MIAPFLVEYRGYERQLQQFVKIKHAFFPIGRDIFKWLF